MPAFCSALRSGRWCFPILASYHGKIAFVWATLTLAPMAALSGKDVGLAVLAHALVGDYLGFIAILFALYVVAGGSLVAGACAARRSSMWACSLSER